SQQDHIEGLPLGTRGGMLIHHQFPLDGEYEFRVFLLRNIVGYMKGLEWPHQLEITIDGERVFLAPVGGEEDNRMSDANFAAASAGLRPDVFVPPCECSRRTRVCEEDSDGARTPGLPATGQ